MPAAECVLVVVQEFQRRVAEGFQVGPSLHQGHLSLSADAPEYVPSRGVPRVSRCDPLPL